MIGNRRNFVVIPRHVPFCHCERPSLSLRADGVAIPAKIPSPLTGEGQGEGEIPPPSNSLPPGEGESAGIAEPVPGKTRNPARRNDN